MNRTTTRKEVQQSNGSMCPVPGAVAEEKRPEFVVSGKMSLALLRNVNHLFHMSLHEILKSSNLPNLAGLDSAAIFSKQLLCFQYNNTTKTLQYCLMSSSSFRFIIILVTMMCTSTITTITSALSSSGTTRTYGGSSSSLRQRLLLQGHKAYGPMILSDSPVMAEILALTGYDHVVVDHEHSPTDLQSGVRLLQAIDSSATHSSYLRSSSSSKHQNHQHRTETIVRVPAHDTTYMKKVLDSLRLPGGVLVPMVNDVDTARAVVQAVRFPEQQQSSSMDLMNGGVRGCAVPFIRASSWGSAGIDRDSYLKQCRDDLLVMVQVETQAGVEAIPEIAQVKGIDAIFLGPLDLSCSIGKMGQFDDPQVQELIARAERDIRKSGTMLAGFRAPGRSLKEMYVDAGYSLICGSLDVAMLRDAARRDFEDAQEVLRDV